MMSIRGTLYELLAEVLVSADVNCVQRVIKRFEFECRATLIPCVRRSGSESTFEDPDQSETFCGTLAELVHHDPAESPRNMKWEM